jgi:hypothetical protein
MPWFPYYTDSHGLKQAQINIRLGLGSDTGPQCKFLVDSGASISIVPSSFIPALIRKAPPGEEQKLPIYDASGKQLTGRPVRFRIIVLNERGKALTGFPETEDTVYVSSGVGRGLLGLTWFEKVGVHFRNFDHRRQFSFALYDPATFGRRC